MAKRRPKKAPQGGQRWAYLCRSGSEDDVVGGLSERINPEQLAEGLVLAKRRLSRPDGTAIEPAFARQAMRTDGRPIKADVDRVAKALSKAILAVYPEDRTWPWSLQVVSPDSRDPKDPRKKTREALDAEIGIALDTHLPRRVAEGFTDELEDADRLAQVWLIDADTVLVGFTAVPDALTRRPGGRLRLTRDDDAPSRSALKLEEAIDWIGLGPQKGDVVIDLGAAPGGWSSVAVKRGARVIAVDYKPLSISLPPKKIRFFGTNAFNYTPDDTADWLLCDLAQRPLDVAKLIGKWGRRVWATQMVVSFKLPMKQKVATLERLFATLEDGGWRGLRARQLFYDKNEITVYGWLDPKIAKRGYRRS